MTWDWRVATLVNIASDYSIGLDKAFVETFEELGGQVVVRESITPDQDLA